MVIDPISGLNLQERLELATVLAVAAVIFAWKKRPLVAVAVGILAILVFLLK